MPQSSVYVHQVRPIYIGQLCPRVILRDRLLSLQIYSRI